jgi:predicted CopG family antitoxin
MSKQTNEEPKELVKTLKISEDTHKRLKKYGPFGDSFDDILNRLMDIAEGKAKK